MVEVSDPHQVGCCALLAVGYVFFLVAWPVALVVQQTFADGLGNLRRRARPTRRSSARCS